jgi:hypothetical protein
MPMFKIEDEQGRWLTDIRLGAGVWKPGDGIPRGRDTLEVIDVRVNGEKTTLVVRGHVPRNRLAHPFGSRQARRDQSLD